MERGNTLMDWKNTVKKSFLPKAIYRFSTIPIKIPVAIFTKLQQIILIFVQDQKRPQIAKAFLRKRTKLELPQFEISSCNTKL